MFRATAKCNVDRWITRVISMSTGIKANGVTLAHHWPTIFIVFFSEQCLVENIQGKFQKYSSQLLFLRNHLYINSPSEPAILNNRSTMRFRLKSSPPLKYKLSKVNYSPTSWGLVSRLSTCNSPCMLHVSPGLVGGGDGGFQWQVHYT